MTYRTLLIAIISIFSIGCAPPKVERKIQGPSQAPSGEEEKIREAVKAAGVKNRVAAIIDNGNQYWTCTIEPDGVDPKTGAPPPSRPIPEQVLVEKKTYKVTRLSNPRQRPET